MSPDLKAKLDLACEKLGMKQAEVLRLALATGLRDFELIDYDLASTISQVAHHARHTERISLVAEDPAEYSAKAPDKPAGRGK